MTGLRKRFDRPPKKTARGELKAPVEIDPKPLPSRFGTDRVGGEMMVFWTMPHERHKLGILMAAVCAQAAGARVVYAGWPSGN